MCVAVEIEELMNQNHSSGKMRLCLLECKVHVHCCNLLTRFECLCSCFLYRQYLMKEHNSHGE